MDVRKQKICQCSNNETISASNSYEDVLKYLESKNCCNGKTCNFESTSKSTNGLCLILPKKQEQNLYKRLILLPAHILYQYTVINALPYGVGNWCIFVLRLFVVITP